MKYIRKLTLEVSLEINFFLSELSAQLYGFQMYTKTENISIFVPLALGLSKRHETSIWSVIVI